MSQGLLQAHQLSFAYGSRTVLESISFSLNPGEFVGVLGPNGAGKSTLLRCLLGILPTPVGSVLLEGRDVHSLRRREVAQRAAFLPQGVRAAFAFPVEDVVAMGRYPHLGRFKPAGPEHRAIIAEAMQRTDVASLAKRRVDELSGGERQRVFLARALAQTTPVLVLDEPTANLDLLHAFELLDLVRGQVEQRGTAALAALHDLSQAARVCHRVIVLHEGRVAADGPPIDVLTEPLLAEVFGVEATVAGEGGDWHLRVHGPAAEAR